MITLYSLPVLFGVADNNGYGLRIFAFMRLAGLPFRHEHIFDASSAPRGQFPYIVDDGETIGDSETIIAYLIEKKCPQPYPDFRQCGTEIAVSKSERTYAGTSHGQHGRLSRERAALPQKADTFGDCRHGCRVTSGSQRRDHGKVFTPSLQKSDVCAVGIGSTSWLKGLFISPSAQVDSSMIPCMRRQRWTTRNGWTKIAGSSMVTSA
jgi:hypothetical protein